MAGTFAIFEDEELDRLAAGAIEETIEEFEDVLPDGYTATWRRYGSGGSWEAKGPRTRISRCKSEAEATWMAWWIVTTDVIATRLSPEQKARAREVLAGTAAHL